MAGEFREHADHAASRTQALHVAGFAQQHGCDVASVDVPHPTGFQFQFRQKQGHILLTRQLRLQRTVQLLHQGAGPVAESAQGRDQHRTGRHGQGGGQALAGHVPQRHHHFSLPRFAHMKEVAPDGEAGLDPGGHFVARHGRHVGRAHPGLDALGDSQFLHQIPISQFDGNGIGRSGQHVKITGVKFHLRTESFGVENTPHPVVVEQRYRHGRCSPRCRQPFGWPDPEQPAAFFADFINDRIIGHDPRFVFAGLAPRPPNRMGRARAEVEHQHHAVAVDPAADKTAGPVVEILVHTGVGNQGEKRPEHFANIVGRNTDIAFDHVPVIMGRKVFVGGHPGRTAGGVEAGKGNTGNMHGALRRNFGFVVARGDRHTVNIGAVARTQVRDEKMVAVDSEQGVLRADLATGQTNVRPGAASDQILAIFQFILRVLIRIVQIQAHGNLQ